MKLSLPFLPSEGTDYAGQVDMLYLYLVSVAVFFTLLIAGLVVFMSLRYRRGAKVDRSAPPHGHVMLETAWALIPFALTLVMFFWGTSLYYKTSRPPADSIEILVTAKQWMWKLQHPQGKREINELHIPLGYPIMLTMTSEDVIHSFYVPAFRVKRDVLPGRYTSTWFLPSKEGKYHLFCAEYCGTEHSFMGGWIYVMKPADYERWLGGTTGTREPPATVGAKLFTQLGCASCHQDVPGARGPSLSGVFGSMQKLNNGTTVQADENYVRESILQPLAKVVDGFEPVMPTYKGLISEDQLFQLVSYVKSLGQVEPKQEAKKP